MEETNSKSFTRKSSANKNTSTKRRKNTLHHSNNGNENMSKKNEFEKTLLRKISKGITLFFNLKYTIRISSTFDVWKNKTIHSHEDKMLLDTGSQFKSKYSVINIDLPGNSLPQLQNEKEKNSITNVDVLDNEFSKMDQRHNISVGIQEKFAVKDVIFGENSEDEIKSVRECDLQFDEKVNDLIQSNKVTILSENLQFVVTNDDGSINAIMSPLQSIRNKIMVKEINYNKLRSKISGVSECELKKTCNVGSSTSNTAPAQKNCFEQERIKLLKEINCLEAIVDKKEVELDALKKNSKANEDELLSRIKNLSNTIKDLEELNQCLISNLNHTESLEKDTSYELSENQSKLISINRASRNVQEGEIATLLNNSNSHLDEVHDKWKQEESSIEEERKHYKSMLSNYESDNKVLRDQIQNLQMQFDVENDQYQNIISTVKIEKEKLHSTFMEEKTHFQDIIKQLEMDKKTLSVDSNHLKSHYAAKEKEKDQEYRELNDLNREKLDMQGEEIYMLRLKIINLIASSKCREEKYQKEIDKRQAEWHNMNHSIVVERAKYREEVLNLKAALKSLESASEQEKASNIKSVENLKIELDEATRSFQEGKTKYEGQIKTLTLKLEEDQKIYQDFKNEVENADKNESDTVNDNEKVINNDKSTEHRENQLFDLSRSFEQERIKYEEKIKILTKQVKDKHFITNNTNNIDRENATDLDMEHIDVELKSNGTRKAFENQNVLDKKGNILEDLNTSGEWPRYNTESSETKIKSFDNNATYPKLPSNISGEINENLTEVYRNTLTKIETQWKQTVFDTEAVWKRKVFELRDLLKTANENSKLASLEKERLHQEKQNLIDLQIKIMAEEERRSAEAKYMRSEFDILKKHSKSKDEKKISKNPKSKRKRSNSTKQDFSSLYEDYIGQQGKLIDCLAALKLIAGDESKWKVKKLSYDSNKEILQKREQNDQENIENFNRGKNHENLKQNDPADVPNQSFIDQIIQQALLNARTFLTSSSTTYQSFSPIRHVVLKDSDDDDDDDNDNDENTKQTHQNLLSRCAALKKENKIQVEARSNIEKSNRKLLKENKRLLKKLEEKYETSKVLI